jgi:hypothetical protein
VGYFRRLYSKFLDFVMRGWSWRPELARFFAGQVSVGSPTNEKGHATIAMTFAFPLWLAETPSWPEHGIDLEQNLERRNLPTDLSLQAQQVKDTWISICSSNAIKVHHVFGHEQGDCCCVAWEMLRSSPSTGKQQSSKLGPIYQCRSPP